MLTKEQIQANIKAMADQGASQEAIQSYLNSLKTGQSQGTQPVSKEGGFLQNVVQGLAKLPGQVYASAKGLQSDLESLSTLKYDKNTGKMIYTPSQEAEKIRNEGVDLGYFGRVKPLGGGEDIFTAEGAKAGLKSSVGSALEGASYLVGGGAAKAGGSLLKTAGKAALEGAKAGALYGAGSSLQDDESFVEFLANTALSTAGGAAGGALLGPVMRGTRNMLTKGKDVGFKQAIGETVDNTLGKFVSKTAQDIEQPIEKVIKKGTEAYDTLYQKITKDVDVIRKAPKETQRAFMEVMVDKGLANKLKTTKIGGTDMLSSEDLVKAVRDDVTKISEKYINRAKDFTPIQKVDISTKIKQAIQESKDSGIIPDTVDIDRATESLLKNYKLTGKPNETLSGDTLSKMAFGMNLDDIMSTSSDVSAEKKVLPLFKKVIKETLYSQDDSLKSMDNEMSKYLMAVEPFIEKKNFKIGQSGVQEIGSLISSFAAAPQGIVASWMTRNFVNKLLGSMFPGAKETTSLIKYTSPQIKKAVEKLAEYGVNDVDAHNLLMERSRNGGIPDPELTQKVTQQILEFANKSSEQVKQTAQETLTKNKTLIKLLKSLGNDEEAIKTAGTKYGFNFDNEDVKIISSLNKNSGKSITPYLDILSRLAIPMQINNE